MEEIMTTGFSAFVGGPFDGQHRNVPDDQSWIIAREGATEHRYLRHFLAGEKRRFSFFAIDTMTVDQAMSYLIHCYAGIAGIKPD